MNPDTNPVVKILGQESDIDYVDQSVQFLFALSVLRTCKGQLITRVLKTLVRAYAALAFVMPLLLNGLPSQMMKDMDHFAMMVVAAIVFDKLLDSVSVPYVNDMVDMAADLSYGIMKANACAAGYTAFATAFGGSVCAPFLGAFIATNGHKFVEEGMGALDIKVTGAKSKDNKVAVLGGPVLMIMGTHLGQSALVSRATLAGLNCAQNYVDLDAALKGAMNMVNSMLATVTSMAKKKPSASKMKMGRAKSPARK